MMDSTTSMSTTSLLQNGVLLVDSTLLQKQPSLPNEFLWPHKDLVDFHTQEVLQEPLIDLKGFMEGDDEVATARAVELVRDACLNHGVFQVINHGVDQDIINAAHQEADAFFKLPSEKKLRGQKKPGEAHGHSGAHAERFSSRLPWKETLSFEYHENDDSKLVVVDYFKSSFGEDFEHSGSIYQRYCEAMKTLSLALFELLGISLGGDRLHYKKFFEDSCSIMRCNYYPPCNDSNRTFGTGTHKDPTSITILYQDQVGGLEVFANNKWQAVKPIPDALVINIGDTFMALCNGTYKSCVHRAKVNKEKERISLAFFVCPKGDKVVRPPQDLICRQGTRKYPDFTWSEFLEFTQKHHRVDSDTFQIFIDRLASNTQTNNPI